jgi:hypothetical protein
MIPTDKIEKQHILAAIADIDATGVPAGRNSKSFDLVYNGNTYPPKLVVSLAVKHATGSELDPSAFIGGSPTNRPTDTQSAQSCLYSHFLTLTFGVTDHLEGAASVRVEVPLKV